jgi:FtsP/CotA-like multicopper oxidase with cupredoxin domain
MKPVSRRDFLRAGGILVAGAAAACAPTGKSASNPKSSGLHLVGQDLDSHQMPGTVGEVDHQKNGFDPTDILTDFDYGKISELPGGGLLREYEIVSHNKGIEVVPGIEYPAWTFNGRIPGPTLRCTEGDRIRIVFKNGSDHPHTMHFHGVHPREMDGVPPDGLVQAGGTFIYEFDAEPFGLHLYHCHAFPLARHIAKGLYGAFIVDPKVGRPRVDHEMIMVMSGYDIDFDDTNDLYAVNGIPFHYQNHPIQIGVGETVRIYLVNIVEFDPLNSFHIHANFFHYFPTGTSLAPAEFTDTIIQGQAQRGILEFKYAFPGMYMFHAHVTEFAELGWTGMFDVVSREQSGK